MTDLARRGLPPVAVRCNGCGGEFESRARHMTTVRCTLCGHANRVKRQENVYAGPEKTYAEPEPMYADEAFPAFSPPADDAPRVSAAAAAVDGDEDLADDDSPTYVYDESGQLVPAEWTKDGRLIPAYLSPERKAAELASRGYRENPAAPPGGCHVTETAPVVQDCPLAAEADFAGLRVCGPHHHALTARIRKTAAPHT